MMCIVLEKKIYLGFKLMIIYNLYWDKGNFKKRFIKSYVINLKFIIVKYYIKG